MLIQFSVENFLSIKDNVVLSRRQCFRKVQCLECVLVHGKLCADFA